jgi:6-pyruvoyltetrahydropterin/6-carboxytetrahydropterin synthase
MYEVTTEASFSGAHKLHDYNGPCENLHGHNWLVKAAVRCDKLDSVGIGIDFKVLKSALRETLEAFDHKDLNDVFDPLHLNPSSENIAKYVFEKLEEKLVNPEVTVHRVEVFETPGNSASYFR